MGLRRAPLAEGSGAVAVDAGGLNLGLARGASCGLGLAGGAGSAFGTEKLDEGDLDAMPHRAAWKAAKVFVSFQGRPDMVLHHGR